MLAMVSKQVCFIVPVFIAGVVMEALMGAIDYATSEQMSRYFVSYSRYKSLDKQYYDGNGTDLGRFLGSPNRASLLMSALFTLANSPSSFVGGLLCMYIGARPTILIGVLISCLSLVVTAGTIQISFFFMLATNCFLFGIGLAFVYISVLHVGIRWLPAWRGLAIGVFISGYGAGALFVPLQNYLLNPENHPPVRDEMGSFYKQEDILDRIPLMFIGVGMVSLFIMILTLVLLVEPPKSWKHLPKMTFSRKFYFLLKPKWPAKVGIVLRRYTTVDETYSSTTASTTDIAEHTGSPEESLNAGCHPISVKPKQVLCRRNFYSLVIAAISIDQVLSQIRSIDDQINAMYDVSYNDNLGIGIAAALSNVFGCLVWGAVVDLTSFKTGLVLLLALVSILMLTLNVVTYVGVGVYFAWLPLVFFCLAGYYTVFPTGIARWYGLEYAAVNYGLLVLFTTVAAVLGPILSIFLYTYVDFSIDTVVTGSICLIGLIVVLVTKERTFVIFKH